MATLTKFPSVKRFGVRYGRTLKEKFGKIEKERLERSLCPLCRKTKMKRLAAGIWECKKCNVKIAGAAYTVQRIVKQTTAEKE